MKKSPLLFLSSLLLFAAALVQLDHLFFKQNDGFCLRTILGQLPYQQTWESPEASSEVKKILNQPFYYLAKGHQSYVFASEDGNHVIKFYRFPSHLRIFPWLSHPISYHFSPSRNEIMAYNERKLRLSFDSYHMAQKELADATGIEWVHLNPTPTLNPETVHLIDATGNHYHVPLENLFFVVQKRFSPIFTALELMRQRNDKEEILKVVHSLLDCIRASYDKEIVDNDPVLFKNYGWDGNRVVYIDIGRFARREEDYDPMIQAEQITPILAAWLQEYDEELCNHLRRLLRQ